MTGINLENIRLFRIFPIHSIPTQRLHTHYNSLPERTEVRLEIFNLLGERVLLLLKAVQEAGTYQIPWDGRNERGTQVQGGVCFYRLQTSRFFRTKKMLFLK